MESIFNKNDYERQACHDLKAKGLSRSEIADRLGLSLRQVKRRLAVSEYKDVTATNIQAGTISGATTKYSPNWNIVAGTISGSIIAGGTKASKLGILPDNDDTYFSGESAQDSFSFPLSKDKALYRYDEADKKREAIRQFIENKYRGKKTKILYLADLHIPFTMYEEVTQIIEQNLDADIVVINGDLLDLFAVSKFMKDKEIALRRELDEGREFLEYLSVRFKDIVITEGNHERRLKSFIKNIIPIDIQFLFPDDTLKVIANGDILKKPPLHNVHVVGSWWINLFDTIFAHPDNYNSANLKTVQNTSEHFQLVRNIWHRVCIIGHTHRAGWLQSGGIKLMETGCLCHDMDYHKGSNFTRAQWTRAYATTIVGEDGLSAFNTVELRLI